MTAGEPGATLVHWCNDKADIYEVRGQDATQVGRMVAALKQMAANGHRLRKTLVDAGGRRTVLQTVGTGCICGPALRAKGGESVSAQIKQHKCFEVPPELYEDGWEHHRILSFDAADLTALFRGLEPLGPVEVLLKRSTAGLVQDSFTLSLTSLFGSLTDKQLTALLEAVETGYYAVPRRITVGRIAALKGVPRTTYEEDIHKAQGKVLRAVAPYLRLYAAR